jgi:membrane dipeptidase
MEAIDMYRIADAHSDFLAYNTLKKADGRLYDHADIERMKTGGVALQTMAAWVPAEDKDSAKTGFEQISYLHTLAEENADVRICTRSKHIARDGINVILSIESGESIGCHVPNIQKVYDLGARMLSLTWNDENAFASGCMAEGGLKPEGFNAISELNRLHIALDVSHVNEQGFWEAVEYYRLKPCASHSCVYDLCSVPRNLKRDQIDLLISLGGFIGINFYTEFLRGRYALIDDILNHIEYILERGGEDVVGFGSDFCGIQYTPQGLNSVADFQKLPDAMVHRGYTDSLIKKICYGNFARYVLEFLH